MTVYNLPQPTTSFIGRSAELRGLLEQLSDSRCRLMNIAGQGGTGKTRLAISVATQVMSQENHGFDDGIVFVPLAFLQTADQIITAIADSAGIELSSFQTPREQVFEFLSTCKMLLILDNFEHLIAGADIVSDLLKHASDIVILVTSRERLLLKEEWVWKLRGLSFPTTESTSTDESYDAVDLFVNRAMQLIQEFTVDDVKDEIIHICQLVEGMPLALELAASWCSTMSVAAIGEQIERDLNFLASPLRNVEDRHRTIRAVFDYSWSLLTENEGEVFRGLTMFRGNFTAEAAQEVTGASLLTLSVLVSKSFIRLNNTGRYDIHSLLQQYGREMLETIPQEYQYIQERHKNYYSELLRQFARELKGATPADTLDTIETDMPDIMMAWRYALAKSDREALFPLLEGLSLYYRMRSRLHELITVFYAAHAMFEEIDPTLFAKITFVLARSVYLYQDVDTGIKLGKKGLAIWREDESVRGQLAYEMASARHALIPKHVPQEASYYDDLYHIYTGELNRNRENQDTWREGWALYSLAWLAKYREEIEESYEYFHESVEVFRSGKYFWAIATPLMGEALTLRLLGRYAEACAGLEEIYAITLSTGDVNGTEIASTRLAEIAYREGDYDAFMTHLHNVIDLSLSNKQHALFYDSLPMNISLIKSSHDFRELAKQVMLTLINLPTEQDRQEASYYISSYISARTGELVKWDYRKYPDLEVVAEQIMQQFEKQGDSLSTDANLELAEPLTPRQLEILALLATGNTNKEIAKRLYISPGTVRVHAHQIFQKLSVKNRTEAVAKARLLGLL